MKTIVEVDFSQNTSKEIMRTKSCFSSHSSLEIGALYILVAE